MLLVQKGYPDYAPAMPFARLIIAAAPTIALRFSFALFLGPWLLTIRAFGRAGRCLGRACLGPGFFCSGHGFSLETLSVFQGGGDAFPGLQWQLLILAYPVANLLQDLRPQSGMLFKTVGYFCGKAGTVLKHLCWQLTPATGQFSQEGLQPGLNLLRGSQTGHNRRIISASSYPAPGKHSY